MPRTTKWRCYPRGYVCPALRRPIYERAQAHAVVARRTQSAGRSWAARVNDDRPWPLRRDFGPAEQSSGIGFITVVLEDALVARGLAAVPVEGFPGLLRCTVKGDFGQWDLLAQGDEESLGVVVQSVFPGNAPEHRRQAVAELATRANYLLRYGSLDMDFADGEVRARTSARGAESLDHNVIAELVRTNLEVAEIFFPAVREVAMEGADPAKAVDQLLQRLTEI